MKTVIEMAREAGGALSCIAEPLEHPWKFSQAELERFADLVREDEREKLALAQKIRPRGKSVSTELLAEREKQQEPVAVYAFRRKGLDDFCTCDERRYLELSEKPNLFETAIFYTIPPTIEAAVLAERERIFKEYGIDQNK